ncbi:MAG: hypothetical protein M1378_08315 [Bacteroidetes bacterium]|nr:hypothetical protein [Bacteroidota bacterium]MCL5034062.1 hypothetical protein [Bacteroidota bacterium]
MALRRISLVVLSALALQACSQKTTFSQKNFVGFYVQLQLTDVQYGNQPAVKKVKVDSLMYAFNLNDSLVNSALAWYGEKPERWEKFVADVQARVDEMRKHYVKPKSR